MPGMYDQILPQKQHRARSGKAKLGLFVALAVVVLALCLVPVVRILSHQYHYKQFVSSLSEQTTRAYYKENLRAEVDGISLRITGDNAYVIYNAMSALGAGQIAGAPPQEEPDARLYYGTFATMNLWDVPLPEDGGRSRGVYVAFHSNEVDFSYILNRTAMDYLMEALSPDTNPLLQELNPRGPVA